MAAPLATYDPLIPELPTDPTALLAFALGIPDEGQRRLGIAIARTLQAAMDAMGQARNVRQMVLTRDARFDTVDERYDALIAATDGLAATQAQLSGIASSYAAALPVSVADRQELHRLVDSLRADLTTLIGQLAAEVATRTAADTALGTRIDAEAAARAKADSDEAAARKAADDALAARATTAEAAATALTTRVAAAETKTAAQDTTIAANAKEISDESTTRAAADTALSTRVTTLEALRLRGTTGKLSVTNLLAAGTQNLTVTLATAMPTADYVALVVLDTTSTLNLSTVTATVTARTTTTVTVRIANSGLSLLSSINLQVLAIQLS